MAAPQRQLAERAPVSARLARFAVDTARADIPDAAIEKARGCLADYLACTLEAGDLPWSRQAVAFVEPMPEGRCSIVGTGLKRSPLDAAFANASIGHGLVREDMHVPSCSHLGVVIWPTLLALAEWKSVDPDDVLAAAVVGYEVAASVGRELFDADLAARIRPTSTVGAMGGAAAAARLMGLDAERTQAAIGFAANAACGLNEWPWAGGNEMFFHAGLAARNAVTAAHLAACGTIISETAIDGRAGLFAAYDRRERADAVEPLGRGSYEILAVYWKPAPACNYVQTPCQAALELSRQGVRAEDVVGIEIDSFPHAVRYPGCDNPGPFSGPLDAKMSLQFSVAAVLVSGEIAETNYRTQDDPEVMRLAGVTGLNIEPSFEAAYPGKQGARLRVTLRDGTTRMATLPDVVAADLAMVRGRLDAAAKASLGADGAARLSAAVDAVGKGGGLAEVAEAAQP